VAGLFPNEKGELEVLLFDEVFPKVDGVVEPNENAEVFEEVVL